MQDLNTINRQNNEAFKDAVQAARNNGQTVVLEKQGLHAVGFKTFSTLQEASVYAAAYLTAAPANNADVLGAL
jgi:hypothetical protein